MLMRRVRELNYLIHGPARENSWFSVLDEMRRDFWFAPKIKCSNVAKEGMKEEKGYLPADTV